MSSRSTIENRGDGIYQVRVPLPFPLRWVNAYLLKGQDGYTVIDPGLHTAESIKVWEESFDTLGISYSDISQIVLTHHHPDHIGLAGTFQQRSGAPVLLSAEGIEQSLYLWGPEREATDELHKLFARHGMDAETGERLREHMESFLPFVYPLPEMTPITAGSLIMMGDRAYRTIEAPGHAYGQFMLLDEAGGNLFCGDHVLPQITPNVGLLPRFDTNPLQSFLDSLALVAQLAVKRAFPGHRDPFEGFAERCHAIIEHHHERLARMIGMLDQPKSGYELCQAFFGTSLSIHQLRFAMAETLAHLVYLRENGEIKEQPSAGGTTAFSNIGSL